MMILIILLISLIILITDIRSLHNDVGRNKYLSINILMIVSVLLIFIIHEYKTFSITGIMIEIFDPLVRVIFY
jgi:formate hydrogenlyase subunit 3/multisubunit Na+/H+ antiporter MnhD subunit